MHPQAAEFIRSARRILAAEHPSSSFDRWSVVEVGSRDVNGRASSCWAPYGSWYGIDIEPGRFADDVQEVGDAELVLRDLRTGTTGRPFNLAVSCEVFEHAPNWREILIEMGAVADWVLVTCASAGRAPHSAIDGMSVRPGEYYRNVLESDMLAALGDADLVPRSVHHWIDIGDLYVLATSTI